MTPSAVSSASRAPESISISRPNDALGELDEGAAVLGVAACGGRNRQNSLHAHGRAQRPVAFERRQRVLDRVGGKKAGRLHLAAEAAQRLFVEERRRAARERLVDHEAHRVRADVDDGERRTVVEASGGVDLGAAHLVEISAGEQRRPSAFAHIRSERCRNRGTESFGDFPRPDRLGLVMK